MTSLTQHPRSRKGFTLVELLTVVAIIGILAGILIPTVGAAMKSAKKAKGRNQMRQYAVAIQNYKAEYGYYPPVGQLNSTGRATLDNTNDSQDFIMAMSGRDYQGNALSAAQRKKLNPKAIPFCTFSEQEFYVDEYSGEITENQLADPFGNKEINIRTESGSRIGVVTGLSITTARNRTSANYTEVRAPVVVYTLFDTANQEAKRKGFESLLSWE